MFVRPIHFVDCFEIPDLKTEFSASLFLYDIDEDNDIELIVGNWDSGDLQNYGEADVEFRKGELNIVKYNNLWKKTTVDGIVSCISAGKVSKKDYADIIVFCSNCLCYFYNIVFNQTSENGEIDKDICQLQMSHKQTVAPNAKSIVLIDIDNDGVSEVIVGFTDRAVRMYKWVENEIEKCGFLSEIVRWDLCSQIGRLTIHWSPKNGTQILASLTGGSYAILFWKTHTVDKVEKKIPYIDYKSISDEYKDTLNAEIRSEIIGNIRRCNIQSDISGLAHGESGQPPYLALCTIDGQVMLLDDDEKIWQVHLGRGELFGLSKIDITNNDVEEVVICSWEGVTYIINHRREIARFCPKHQCQAFIAGNFAVAPGCNQPVMIYSTFDNSLMIYYNLNLNRIPARSFLHEFSSTLKDQFEKAGFNVENHDQIRKATSEILYKWPIVNKSNDTSDFFDDNFDNISSPLLKSKPHRSEAL